jgi:hypothetical protein
MILPGQLGGKVGRRRDLFKEPHANGMRLFVFLSFAIGGGHPMAGRSTAGAEERFFENHALFDRDTTGVLDIR